MKLQINRPRKVLTLAVLVTVGMVTASATATEDKPPPETVTQAWHAESTIKDPLTTPPTPPPAAVNKPKENKPAAAKKKAKKPKPVAWLNKAQMKNAQAIMAAAEKQGLGKRAKLIGLMTAIQESRISVLASTKYPHSMNVPHQGVGSDHDSVGIMQQRPSMGWGSVRECMDPEYAAKAFFQSLKGVDGWKGMRYTHAAQAVQQSAFPEAYAQHRNLAKDIYSEIIKH